MQAFLQMRQPLEPSLALDILHKHSPAYAGEQNDFQIESNCQWHPATFILYMCQETDCGIYSACALKVSLALRRNCSVHVRENTAVVTQDSIFLFSHFQNIHRLRDWFRLHVIMGITGSWALSR